MVGVHGDGNQLEEAGEAAVEGVARVWGLLEDLFLGNRDHTLWERF
jgi:hypothetical protein